MLVLMPERKFFFIRLRGVRTSFWGILTPDQVAVGVVSCCHVQKLLEKSVDVVQGPFSRRPCLLDLCSVLRLTYNDFQFPSSIVCPESTPCFHVQKKPQGEGDDLEKTVEIV